MSTSNRFLRACATFAIVALWLLITLALSPFALLSRRSPSPDWDSATK